ncbi:endonuclease/exonuclease/phosphatase family protein [Schumannella luteola]|uniref:Endonuclease/exonuclease/phosphatase family metal-dependent hydrolase n=1 Tax=Schumannella luteola TaxID=472059 RepID=A0A852Y5M7_9MICO|nr:endonuclease/exonuclease/phosphatase family protein [Schumannella luteola]NYG97553.1 endonuclease/exonuclease/phosphatase family metal-dependent hydrolase [Schumannella luteola]TPX01595.1 endonuclease/exonuclease/phosphatase family protein [Schumannella luteola]
MTAQPEASAAAAPATSAVPAAAAAPAAAASGAPTSAPPLRVATANVRIPVDEGTASWAARGELLARVLRESGAHVIGVQELRSGPALDLLSWMPGTAWFGRDRHGGHDDEHVGLLYRSERVELLDGGDFWLSDTPDAPGSITWGNLYPRMVTWARFRDSLAAGDSGADRSADGNRGGATRDPAEFLVAVTHLPYRAEDEPARLRSAQLIGERLSAIAASPAAAAAGIPIVLLGDMNVQPDGAVHAALTSEIGFEDARLAPAPATHAGPDGTFHGFTGDAEPPTGEGRIDWILQRGFTVTATATLDAHAEADSGPAAGTIWPSDHFPVAADLIRSRCTAAVALPVGRR